MYGIPSAFTTPLGNSVVQWKVSFRAHLRFRAHLVHTRLLQMPATDAWHIYGTFAGPRGMMRTTKLRIEQVVQLLQTFG